MSLSKSRNLFASSAVLLLLTVLCVLSSALPAYAADADLVMTSVSGPSIGVTGGTISISSTVLNQGTGTGNTPIDLYLSTDQNITTGDVNLDAWFAYLQGGESSTQNVNVMIPTSLTPGTYYIGAIADKNNSVPESDETNNGLAGNTIEIAIGADLVMTSVSGSVNGVTGGTISISSTALNQGMGATGLGTSLSVGLYLSTDQNITAGDVYLTSWGSPPLQAGASSSYTIGDVEIPTSLTPGTYYIGAIADKNNYIPESDETNNGLAGNAIEIAIGADLVMTSVSGPSSAVTGGLINITDTVLNQGTGATNSFKVGLYLSTDQNITTGDLNLQNVMSFLEAGASINQSNWVVIPTSLTSGTYYIGAIADKENSTPESDETNNTLAGNAIEITYGADLVVSSVSGPTSGVVGDQITISRAVLNQGTGMTDTFKVGLYLSSDQNITTGDVSLNSEFVSLEAGESSIRNINLTIPAGLSTGTYYIGAIADYANDAPESDETNNSLAGNTIVVTDGTTPPQAPAVDPVASPTGNSPLTLSGTKDADTSIWINGTEYVALDSQTTWQTSYTLQLGVNSLAITSKNSTGTESQPTNVSITYDNVAPTMAGSTPADGSVVNSAATVSITLADTYSAIDLAATVSGATVTDGASQPVPGAWSDNSTDTVIFTPTNAFTDYTYTVSINPTDTLGNAGAAQVVFTVDTTPPPAPVFDPVISPTGITSQTITGTKSADTETVVVSSSTATTGTVTYPTSTTWSVQISGMSEGGNVIGAYSLDAVGNQSTTVSATITVNSNLASVWHMDGDWVDSSGNGNSGTPYNGATFSTDFKAGTHSGSFNGSNYVDFGNGASLNITNAVTIEAWVKPNTVSGTQFVAGRPYSTSSSWSSPWVGWHIGVRNGKMATWLNINGVDREYDAGTIAAGTWQHIAMTFDGTWRKSYINGVNVYSSNAYTGSIQFSGNPNMVVGVRSATALGEYFNGLVDDVRVYNRALTEAEILNNYNGGSVPQAPTVDPVTSPTATSPVTLTGTKNANTSIWINGVEAVALDSSTTWQTPYGLQPGVNDLAVTSKNGSGLESQPANVSIIYDNAPPAIYSSTPADNSAVASAADVTIILSDVYSDIDLSATTSVAAVTDGLSQAVPGDWTTSGADTVIFTPTSAFGDDTYTVSINPTDTLGNAGTGQVVFTLDSTAPAPPAFDPVISPTGISSQTVTGTKTADAETVVVTSSTATIGTVTYPTSTTWRVYVSNMTEGDNVISVHALDALGNQSNVVYTIITVDSNLPAPGSTAVEFTYDNEGNLKTKTKTQAP